MKDYNRRRDLKRKEAAQASQFEPWRTPQPAKVFERNGSIQVPGMPGFVWVHQFGVPESPMAVRSGGAQVTAGLWVWIAPTPKPPYEWRIVGPYTGDMTYSDAYYSGRASLEKHAATHQWPQESAPGSDPVSIYMPAIYPLKCTGDGTSLTVTVNGFIWGDGNRFAGGTLDLTSYVPASDSVPVLVYYDTDTEALAALSGSYTAGGDVYTAGTYTWPTIPETAIASAFVVLSAGQTTITTASDIYDARSIFNYTNPPTKDDIINSIMTGAEGEIMVDGDGNVMTES